MTVETLSLLASAAAWALVAVMGAVLVAYDYRRRTPEREPKLTPEEAAELEAMEAAVEAARRQL